MEQEAINVARTKMLQKLQAGKKIKPADIKAADDALVRQQQAEYPIMLLGFALNVISAFMNPDKEKLIGHNLALMTKHVYLSNDGKILKIELEKWGWYLLTYINKRSPGYLNNIRKKRVVITNKSDELTDKSFSEAALSFGVGNTGEAMGQEGNALYELLKVSRMSLGSLVGGDLEKVRTANVVLVNYSVPEQPLVCAFIETGSRHRAEAETLKWVVYLSRMAEDTISS